MKIAPFILLLNRLSHFLGVENRIFVRHLGVWRGFLAKFGTYFALFLGKMIFEQKIAI